MRECLALAFQQPPQFSLDIQQPLPLPLFESDTHVFTEPASGTAAIMHRDMLTPLADLLIALSKAQLKLGAQIDENRDRLAFSLHSAPFRNFKNTSF